MKNKNILKIKPNKSQLMKLKFMVEAFEQIVEITSRSSAVGEFETAGERYFEICDVINNFNNEVS